ncbi:hypothetical protein [Pseudomonas donghuensis]|uniref:hypothetical protein n=1 Tax=Pseudomonas donghuensis TaxID=1163398 RepID=UPI002E12DF70|nr:hypothetical protein VP780_12750 [Pseudomonas donghuensis]
MMHAPGNTSDLTPELEEKWTQALSRDFSAEVLSTRRVPDPDQPRAWFYDAAGEGLAGTVTRNIIWDAFPKKMKQENWGEADRERNLQEEYCEWEVARVGGKVVRVTVTTETADYYDFLWKNDKNKLLALYQQFVSPDVLLSDLGDDEGYNPQNKWNWPTQGRGALMHMAQVNNTLRAAMNLSARASWPVVSEQGTPVVSEQELIEAIPFGDKFRHSDPHIGAQINELVRAGNEVSFADPVGLYIHEVNLTGFETPDGGSAQPLMRVTRGENGLMLRVVFEAPKDAGYVLGDVTIDGREIRFGSQIVEKIKIRIRGAARTAAQPAPKLQLPNLTVVGHAGPIAGKAFVFGQSPGLSRIVSIPSLISPE